MIWWERIIFLFKSRFESLIFWALLILLLVISWWSLKLPNQSSLMTEPTMVNKIESTDSRKQQQQENWRESNIASADIYTNLDQSNSTEGEKPGESTIDRDRSNDLLIQQFPEQKNLDKLKYQAMLGADDKKLPKSPSYSTENPVFKEKVYGYLIITLKNAHEYGFGYLFIDDIIWQQGEYNTTPLKVKLPVGYHKIAIKRDNFFSSPIDTSIFVEKEVAKRISFILIPNIKMGSVKSSMKNNFSNSNRY